METRVIVNPQAGRAVVTIYSVEQSGGVHFFTMELLAVSV